MDISSATKDSSTGDGAVLTCLDREISIKRSMAIANSVDEAYSVLATRFMVYGWGNPPQTRRMGSADSPMYPLHLGDL